MKQGDIICWQFEVWPRPRYGQPYGPTTVFASPDKLLFGRLYSKTPSFKVAYWRVKKLNTNPQQ